MLDNLKDKFLHVHIVEYEPNTVIKDPYMLEFLGLDNNVNYLEKELEDALISICKNFYFNYDVVFVL